MALTRRTVRPLVFPIGDKDYTVPPVGIDTGWELTKILTTPQNKLDKTALGSVDLFKLAMTAEVWDAMRGDGVSLADAWRAGMAALAHFQVLMQDTSPGAADAAEKAAEAVWESGINPEALAAFMAAQTPSNRASRRSRSTAAASATPPPASTTGTSPRPATPRRGPKATASAGRSSSTKKR